MESTTVINGLNPPQYQRRGHSLVPAAGDLIALPPWLRQLPYRVLRIAPSPIPDWLRLDGYLIEADGRHQPRRVDVLPRYLRRLPDPQRAPQDGAP